MRTIYVEKMGTGVLRINNDLVNHGLPKAEFDFDENNFAIILRDNTDEVTDEGVNVLLNFIISDPGKRAPYYAEKIGTSVKNIERWLKKLKDNNSVEFRGAPKTGGYWEVVPEE